jgi:hypothetical protein
MGTMRTSCWKSRISCAFVTACTLRHARGGGEVDDLHFVRGAQVIENGIEQEAVELRFGQRVGAFEFDGVLRGQHEEGRRQLVLMPRTVQESSCMASSSADCVLGGVRLISSASRMLPKMGPGRTSSGDGRWWDLPR